MPDGSHPTTEPTAPAPPGEALSRALADPASAWPDVVLREHQLEALDELASRLVARRHPHLGGRADRLRQDHHVPRPGGGLGGSTLVLVPRRNLAEQTAAGLARHFRWWSRTEGPDSAGKPGVAVCTYQAALRHQERMDWEPVTLLICDEAHDPAQTR